MQIFCDCDFESEKGTCLALGSFDACHAAHMKLIGKAVTYAKKNNLLSGIYQFILRPAFVLNPNADNKLIYTNEHKINILENTGADFSYFENFGEEFMKKSAEEFVMMLKNKFNVKCVVIGFHYRFGYKGEGNCETMRALGEKYGFETIVLPPVKIGDTLVSSTYIRELIKNGDVSRAALFLGRMYSISSFVKHDRGVGSKMGIPTANLEINEKLVLPSDGVYAGFVLYNKKKYGAVANVGKRPTFNLDRTAVEAFIMDFNENIYGKRIELFFIEKLRDEIKFENSDQLKRQILSDIDKSKKCFENYLSQIK